MNITVVILAAGSATRMKLGKNKMFYELRKPILGHTLEIFEKHSKISNIIIVANNNEIEICQKFVGEYSFSKVSNIVSGGGTRQESCYNGVKHCDNDTDMIMIHDGARPFTASDTISRTITDAKNYGVSVVGVPAKDTIKESDGEFVSKTLDRGKLWQVQTPQTFKSDIIRIAHDKAKLDNFVGTDDTSLAERLGYDVKLTLGTYDNIKITTPDDLVLAEKILDKKRYNVCATDGY